METARYVLGHSHRELERLSAQARLLEPVTRQFFLAAGIARGMRVLDVGSGAGDVAILAAELVGRSGQVVGVDRVSDALVVARQRVNARSLSNVSFLEGDPTDLVFDQPFDAVVGRYVLLFQRDLPRMLRGLASQLKAGGLLVFHEPDWASACSSPKAPLYDSCVEVIVETCRKANNDTNMALKLHAAFVAAGLPAPSMRMQTMIGGVAATTDFFRAVAELVAILEPESKRFGVAAASKIGDTETLSERLIHEVASSNSVIIGRSEIGAWSHL
jgi:ubiquinone/menaquinone biosynthesis C-methylase UbiE